MNSRLSRRRRKLPRGVGRRGPRPPAQSLSTSWTASPSSVSSRLADEHPPDSVRSRSHLKRLGTERPEMPRQGQDSLGLLVAACGYGLCMERKREGLAQTPLHLRLIARAFTVFAAAAGLYALMGG